MPETQIAVSSTNIREALHFFPYTGCPRAKPRVEQNTSNSETLSTGKMKFKLIPKGIARTMFVLCLFLTVFLVPVKAQSYDVVCRDTDNPLNMRFEVPREILVDGPSVDIGPVAIDFLDPRDVACNANYEDVTVEKFKGAVTCNLVGTQLVICTMNDKCIEQRKEALQRLRKALMKVLDEVVLKMKGIRFFNAFGAAKPLFFGTEPLSKLTGLQILKRVTNNKLDIIKGYSMSTPLQTFKGENFQDFFGKAVGLYARLKEAEAPTGRWEERNMCIRPSRMSYMPPNELYYCYDLFFNSWKENRKLDIPDRKLIALLEEALKFIVNDLSEGKKQFGELKLPFIGHCIGSDGMPPTSLYMNLMKTVETVKNL